MNTLFIALALFVHDLDNGTDGGRIMIRKTDISAIYDADCRTLSGGHGLFERTKFGYRVCTRVVLQNGLQYDVQGSAVAVMLQLK